MYNDLAYLNFVSSKDAATVFGLKDLALLGLRLWHCCCKEVMSPDFSHYGP